MLSPTCVPRDPADLDLLVDAIRARPEPTDLDVVVGTRGPLSPPEACGLIVPIVAFDQLYSFDRGSLLSGKVGCCDSSKNTHAHRHAREQAPGDQIIRSLDAGESWLWCFTDATAVRARSAR